MFVLILVCPVTVINYWIQHYNKTVGLSSIQHQWKTAMVCLYWARACSLYLVVWEPAVVSGAVYHIILCAQLLISVVLTQCMLSVLAAITVALLRVNDNCYVLSSPSVLANGLKLAQVLSTQFFLHPSLPISTPILSQRQSRIELDI